MHIWFGKYSGRTVTTFSQSKKCTGGGQRRWVASHVKLGVQNMAEERYCFGVEAIFKTSQFVRAVSKTKTNGKACSSFFSPLFDSKGLAPALSYDVKLKACVLQHHLAAKSQSVCSLPRCVLTFPFYFFFLAAEGSRQFRTINLFFIDYTKVSPRQLHLV